MLVVAIMVLSKYYVLDCELDVICKAAKVIVDLLIFTCTTFVEEIWIVTQ